MSSALMYLGICILGYIAAIPLRKFRDKLGWFGMAQSISVTCLVFAMGIRVGANKDVVQNLDTYGLYALVFTIVVLICSVITIHFARKFIGLGRDGLAKAPAAAAPTAAADDTAPQTVADATAPQPAADADAAKTKKGPVLDRMTLSILISVAAGILVGYFYFLRNYPYEQVASGSSLAITIGLCVLLIFVGLDLGLEGQVISNIRRVGLKILILPLSVAVGTLAGALLCTLVLPLAANESLAVGAGFAWYSLGAGIIMDAGLEVAGAISFMHNVMRELFSIVLVPIVAKRLGYVESIGLPASVCMDVCLPIVEQSTNGTTTVYSFINGFMLSMSVPFLVPLFLAL